MKGKTSLNELISLLFNIMRIESTETDMDTDTGQEHYTDTRIHKDTTIL